VQVLVAVVVACFVACDPRSHLVGSGSDGSA
jgi:hypothetical protein